MQAARDEAADAARVVGARLVVVPRRRLAVRAQPRKRRQRRPARIG